MLAGSGADADGTAEENIDAVDACGVVWVDVSDENTLTGSEAAGKEGFTDSIGGGLT